MKKLITTVAFALCCSAAFAQMQPPTIVQTPDGRILQCLNVGGVIKCY